MKLEQTILKNLIYNEEFLRKVLPFIKEEYFTDRTDRAIFNEISKFTEAYNSTPTIEAIELAIKEKRNLSDDEVEKCESCLQEIVKTKHEESKIDWLVDKTEEFCQEKAIYNAVLGSISILDGKDKTQDKGSIPKLLSDALAISFDSSVGHDYMEDSDARYEFYHRTEERIPFDLEFFNKITKGGLPNKTLNIALAGTGVGKSLFMCHVGAGCMVQGKNVLYITMEMSEEKIAERIDANLLNVTVDDLVKTP
jgi:replicative DNA helicase